MTLYEILSLTTPIALMGIGCVLKTVTDSISRLDVRITHLENKFDFRITALEKDLYNLQKEVFFIKGLIEGKKSLD